MILKKTLIVTSIMLLTAGVRLYLINPEEVVAKKPLSSFPQQIASWSGVEERFDDSVYRFLGVDDSFYANYRSPNKPWVNLYVGFYQSQREGELIHSPKNCMPGGGWKITDVTLHLLQLGDAVEHEVIKLVLEKGSSKHISLYWYHSRGRIISSEYLQKIYLVWDAITRNRTDGSFVRLIAPVIESEEQTMATLIVFVRNLFPILQDYIPS